MLIQKIDHFLWPLAMLVAKVGTLLFRARQPEQRPLIVRPGGMGDLILLCVAIEELGLSPRDFCWVIEKRSEAWARYLGLDHVCYDRGLAATLWRIAGRFREVINSEQLYGLTQAVSVLAKSRGGAVTSFATNRGKAWADRTVAYDADATPEADSFGHLVSAAIPASKAAASGKPRPRRRPSHGKPMVGIAGLQSPSRHLTQAQWTDFIRAKLGDTPFTLAAAPQDLDFAQRLCADFQGQGELFQGDFAALCAAVAEAEEVLTVDGGFVHIASYFGVPATVLFTSGRFAKWAPLGAGSQVVRRLGLNCQPCTLFGQTPPCPHGFLCKDINLRQISPPPPAGYSSRNSTPI